MPESDGTVARRASIRATPAWEYVRPVIVTPVLVSTGATGGGDVVVAETGIGGTERGCGTAALRFVSQTSAGMTMPRSRRTPSQAMRLERTSATTAARRAC